MEMLGKIRRMYFRDKLSLHQIPLALFGQDGYGTRMGLLARPMLIAQAVGTVAAAVILDKLGSTPLLVVMCTLATASLIASFGLPSK